MWVVKSLSRVVSANRVDASGCDRGACGSQCSLDRRFLIEEILTGIIVKHRTLKSAKWEEGKGKKVLYFINKWIIQSKTIGGAKS